MPLVFGAQGVTPTLRGQASNVLEVQAGSTQIIAAGTWLIGKKYCRVQYLDAITGVWRNIGDDSPWSYVRSDGNTVRLANQTGCAVGALLTNLGSGHTVAPTITPSIGASVWQAIVGGAVSSTVTVTAGGTNYAYPPIVEFAAPPPGGIQATGFSTLSGSNVQSITVVDQGAGYTIAPQIALLNDTREGLNGTTTGSGASATCVLAGAGQVTGVLCVDHGNPISTLPTLTFSTPAGGASAVATVLMDWSVTGLTVAAAGAGYTPVLGGVEVSANTRLTGGTAGITNPTMMANIVRQRRASLFAPTTATGQITSTGVQVNDGGHYTYAPLSGDNLIVVGASIVSVAANIALQVGGNNDVVSMFPI